MSKYSASIAGTLQALSTTDFLALGADHIAYVKPVKLNERVAWAVYAADGRAISTHLTAHAAAAAARQSDLLPISVQ